MMTSGLAKFEVKGGMLTNRGYSTCLSRIPPNQMWGKEFRNHKNALTT